MLQLLKRPSAFLPPAISAALLVMLLTALAQGRLTPQPDEDTRAHLFQILMPVQFALMLAFAVKWLPQSPKPALFVLAVQTAAAGAVLAIVYLKHL